MAKTITFATKFALSPSLVRLDPKPSLPPKYDYGSVSFWDGRYLSYPPRLASEWYCNYDTLKPILAAHCYLPANNNAEITSNEDSDGDYDNNKGGDSGR